MLGNPAVEALTEAWRADKAATLDARAHTARVAAAQGRARARVAEGGAALGVEGPPRAAGGWWAARARGLRAGWTARAEVCGRARVATAACGACGTRVAVPVRCGLAGWCETCADSYRRRWYVMTREGLDRALDAERARWRREGARRGQRPDVTMITLTVRDTGDLLADRERITRAWRRLRSWLHQRDGRSMPYVMTWELTPGTHGRGHVHAHVAAIWPWRDLRALDAEWQRATDGEGRTVDVQGQRARTPRAAARYVAAYVDGVGVGHDTPDDLRAAWVQATYGRRRWSASEGLVGHDVGEMPCPECECAMGRECGWACQTTKPTAPWTAPGVPVPRVVWGRPPPLGPPLDPRPIA